MGALATAAAATPVVPVTAPAAATAPAAPAPFAAPEILERAEQAQQRVDQVRRSLARTDGRAELAAALDGLVQPVEDKLRAYTPERLQTLPVVRLESLEKHWVFDQRRLRHWQAEAQRAIGPMGESAAQLTRLRSQWAATRAGPDFANMPAALAARVEAVLLELDAAEQALSPRLADHLALQQRARTLETRLQAGLDEVAAAIAEVDRRLLRLDAPPLWALRGGSPAAPTSGLDEIGRGLDIETRFARDYLAAAPPGQRLTVVVQLLLLPLLLWAAWWSRRTHGRAAAPADDAEAVLRRPLSAWLLLAMLSTIALKGDGPLLQREVALLLALVPALRLVPAHALRAWAPWPQLAMVLYVLNWACLLVMDSSGTFRLVQLALAVAGAALTLSLLLAHRRRVAAGSPGLPRAVLVLAWSAAGLLLGGALAHLVGNVTLGETLTSGVFDSAYLALLLYTAVAVLATLLRLLAEAAQGTPLQALAALRRPVARGLAWLALLGWLVYAAGAMRLLRPSLATLAAVLGHRFELGELSVSLGDVLVFGVSVLLAYAAARLVRGTLRRRLRDRASLPRGAGNSIASLSYYAVLLLGFLVALSAAGFQVSQLALVFGALGVGIGFGLQSLVGNFVSGIVLMFERPIQPGDVVEIGGTTGRVREIGLRATVLRTFEGADVVVPNGTLLAANLTNWTLYDRSRRVEARIGVGYGADVKQVLAVLEAAARATPGAAEEPPPSVLFMGYGDSSLDFVVRVWTHDFDRWVALRGELLASLVLALRDAGIEIPYNQLDVNLRSADSAAPAPTPAPKPGAAPAGPA